MPMPEQVKTTYILAVKCVLTEHFFFYSILLYYLHNKIISIKQKNSILKQDEDLSFRYTTYFTYL